MATSKKIKIAYPVHYTASSMCWVTKRIDSIDLDIYRRRYPGLEIIPTRRK